VADKLPPMDGVRIRSMGSVSIPGKAEKLSLSTADLVG
jgi:hypothetical protein